MIEKARSAWLNLSHLRASRRRLKAFTYGRQWDDRLHTPDGRVISEHRKLIEEGRTPITNNILRQMVKSIIGRYRYLCTDRDESASISADLTTSAVSETDARLLEEFLISGIAAQRVEEGEAVNIAPDRLFFHTFADPDARDLRLVGMLHDLPLAHIIRRFGDADPHRAQEIRRAYAGSGPSPAVWNPASPDINFDSPALPDTLRVIELWQRVSREYLSVYDPFTGTTSSRPIEELTALEGLNRGRAECDSAPLCIKHCISEQWEGTWLTPKGHILHHQIADTCPIILKLYPLIDGEVHSLVADVIDQQKYINRLISMLDHIISSSAKGVLLYPADQLPEGFTWKDLRRIWSNPMGILPFKRTSKSMVPQQVTTGSSSGAGATDMLKMQLSLFDEISGSTASLRGNHATSGSTTGEGLFRAQLENATISMLDILAAFHSFILRRNTHLSPASAACGGA